MANRIEDRFRFNAVEVANKILNFINRGKPYCPDLPDVNKSKALIDKLGTANSAMLLCMYMQVSMSIWDQIFVKNKDALINNIDQLLPLVNKDQLESYKKLFTLRVPATTLVAKNATTTSSALLITEEEVESLWKFLRMMIRQCIEYALGKVGASGVFVYEEINLTREQLQTLKVKWEATKEKKAV